MQILTLNVPLKPSALDPLGDHTHLIEVHTREEFPTCLPDPIRVGPNYFLRNRDGTWDNITDDFAAEVALKNIFNDAPKSGPTPK